MPVRGTGPYKLRKLSAELKAAGTQGQGLRRELYRAINDAAKPLVAEVKDPENLRSHMPNRYADVLAADLSVTAVKRGGHDPGVTIRAKGRTHKRKVELLDQGLLVHPVFGDRKRWVKQTRAMQAGFFTDKAQKAAPDIRKKVLAAMHDVGKRITS